MADDVQLHPDLQALIDDQLALAQRLHAVRSLAPIAATMDLAGEITGAALLASETTPDQATADDAVGLLTQQFTDAARRRVIRASVIFFHGSYDRRSAPLPAPSEPEANCLVAFLDHRDGQAIVAVINYLQDSGGTWRYAAPELHLKKPLIFGGQP